MSPAPSKRDRLPLTPPVPVRDRIARDVVRALATVSGRRAVPLGLVAAIRRIGTGPGALLPASRRTDASTLLAAPLRQMLQGEELGYWALGPRTIDELVRIVLAVRPATIIEFGSGSSTIVLAWALRHLWGDDGMPRLLSVEQDAGHAERTCGLLERSGLAGVAAVVVAPLGEVHVDGSSFTCYLLPEDAGAALGGRRADLVLIDGPAGAPGIRFGTLPIARPYLADGARFVLDDAMRDSELETGRRWAALPWVHVEGIRIIEKGILLGTVQAA
jgi:hypothetical protein